MELVFVGFAAYLAPLLEVLSEHRLPFWVGCIQVASPSHLQLEYAVKTVNTFTHIAEIIGYFVCQYFACLFVCLPICTRPEIIWHIYTIIGDDCNAGVGCVFSVLWGAKCLPSL